MYAVAVSYLEWIRWIATGWFRCADRVVWLENAEDQLGVDALMSRTPDLPTSDDQGYVIVCIKSNALLSHRRNNPERSVGHLWVNMEAVASFHPLSDRGARLLEADAERASVRLGKPIFESKWENWRDRQLEDEAHWRGLSLCVALGLLQPDFKSIQATVKETLAGRELPPNAVEIRDGAYEGTRALGWVAAIGVALIDPSMKAAFKEKTESKEIRTIVKSLRQDFDLKRPLLVDDASIQISRTIDGILADLQAEMPPLELMATVLHYQSLALRGLEISLEALVDDLASLALVDPMHASLAAYFIGRSMENVAVSTLLYQSNPERYATHVNKASRLQLDVMAIAAKRLEDIPQVVKLNSDSAEGDDNPSAFHDGAKPIATDISVERDSVLEARQPINGNSSNWNFGEENVNNSSLSSNSGSEVGVFSETAFVDNKNQSESNEQKPFDPEATSLNPFETGDCEIAQPRETVSDLRSDLSQSSVENLDRVTAPLKDANNGRKVRQQRKTKSAA